MNRSKDIGTKGETAVVRVIRPRGFPHAERRALHGTHDLGDITGTPGIVWSVKAGDTARGASDAKVEEWLNRAEELRVHAVADIAVLVLARRGIGAPNADRWWAVVRTGRLVTGPLTGVTVRLTLGDACRLLVESGYGSWFEVTT